jgi:site-specific recombinase XerD
MTDKETKRRGKRKSLRDVEAFGRLRDRVILVLLRETDLLPDAVPALTVGSFDPERARLEPEPGRYVLLNGYAVRTLAEYLEALDAYEPPGGASPLFPGERGGFLPESHCWKLIREEMKLAGTLRVSSASPVSEPVYRF